MPKPPHNQPSLKEIILRYVNLDPSMRPIDIKAKLMKDHGIETTRNYIGITRTNYLECLDIDSILISGRRLCQVDTLLGRLRTLQKDVASLIKVMEKKPPPVPKEKKMATIDENGSKVYTCRRTAEKRDRYNATRREKARREKLK